MAKKQTIKPDATPSQIILPGVTNYEKLKVNKKRSIHTFDPFKNYSSKAAKNIEAEPLDPRYLDDSIYSQMLLQQLQDQTWKRFNKSTTFFSLEPKRKRQRLQGMSSYDMIDEVLTKVTDELIVTGTGSEYPVDIDIDRAKLIENGIKEEFIDTLEKRSRQIFNAMYNMYGFRDTASKNSLWNQIYEFLIEGSKAYTLIYDSMEKPKQIIGIVEIDALELEPFVKDGVRHWIHRKALGFNNDERIILYDSQVIVLDWSNSKANARFSYLEQLIRSFNNARIMDETKIIWGVTNSMFRSVFKVPTQGLSRIKAATTLATEMNRYHDDINYNSDTGELVTNGNPNMKFHKEYWFAEGDQGTPSVETVGSDGPDMSETSTNDYFNKKFYRNSRVPYSRFDAGSSETWNLDAKSQLREEMTFGRFIQRIRDVINPLFLKPVLIQLAIEFPEIRNDSNILNAIKVRYESYSIFEQLMQMEVMQTKVDFIEKMKTAFMQKDPDGNDVPFFSQKYLIEKYMTEIDEDDIKLNERYLKEEEQKMFEYIKRKAALVTDVADTLKESKKKTQRTDI